MEMKNITEKEFDGITVTKCFDFCYGHHLPDYKGKCSEHHGHNSRMEVEVGPLDGGDHYPGMIMDFTQIKAIVNGLIDVVDHKNLNDLPQFADRPPTAENIVAWFVRRLKATPLSTGLVRVRISETPDSWAEWREEGVYC